jgi:hypothetical protein
MATLGTTMQFSHIVKPASVEKENTYLSSITPVSTLRIIFTRSLHLDEGLEHKFRSCHVFIKEI